MESIYHQVGRIAEEAGQVVIATEAGVEGFAVFGPYTVLEAGDYTVRFTLRPGEGVPVDRVGSGEVCRLDAFAPVNATVLAARGLAAEDLAGDAAFDLSFSVLFPTSLEFRVWTTGLLPLRVTYDRPCRCLRRRATDFSRFVEGRQSASSEIELLDKLLGPIQYFHQRGMRFVWRGDLLTAEFQGLRVAIHDPIDLQVFGEIVFNSNYGFQWNRPVHVVDVGMNVGVACLFFAQKGEVRRVTGYEPGADAYRHALGNLALNDAAIREKVTAHPVGLSDRDEEVLVVSSQKMINPTIAGGERDLRERIRLVDAATALGPVVAAAKADGAEVILKIDCEGGEHRIFRRLIEAGLFTEFRAILMEWHKWGATDDDFRLTSLLAEHGFFVFDFHDRTHPDLGMVYAVNVRR